MATGNCSGDIGGGSCWCRRWCSPWPSCFTPPNWLAEELHIPWKHLHGLELVLLIWGTWHGLMQTYGFMRIYDIKRGVHDRWSARLDHWLCLAVFVAGVVFSDARVFGIAKAMWESGLPIFGPEWLSSCATGGRRARAW